MPLNMHFKVNKVTVTDLYKFIQNWQGMWKLLTVNIRQQLINRQLFTAYLDIKNCLRYCFNNDVSLTLQ